MKSVNDKNRCKRGWHKFGASYGHLNCRIFKRKNANDAKRTFFPLPLVHPMTNIFPYKYKIECLDFTLSDCDLGNCDLIGSFDQVDSANSCQDYCSLFPQSICNMFDFQNNTQVGF